MVSFKAIILGVSMITVFVFAPAVVSAQAQPQGQAGFVPLTKDFPLKVANVSPNEKFVSLTDFLNSAFKMVLSFGAIAAVLRIGYAGYQYMVSDAWGEKSHAKEILGDVVIGLLLLLSVWLILNQINPDILKLQIKGVTDPSAQTR